MITTNHLSLARQVDIVFKELEVELGSMTSGTVFMQIRNNVIGKFGIKHNPITGRNGCLEEEGKGLNASQLDAFRSMAMESLKFKKYWTHGEISYDFTLKHDTLIMDATLESNYNMANLLIQRYPNKTSAYTYQESSSA